MFKAISGVRLRSISLAVEVGNPDVQGGFLQFVEVQFSPLGLEAEWRRPRRFLAVC
jgi:hypothetical protein